MSGVEVKIISKYVCIMKVDALYHVGIVRATQIFGNRAYSSGQVSLLGTNSQPDVKSFGDEKNA